MKTNSECKPCRSYATLEHIQIIKFKTHPTQQIVNTKRTRNHTCKITLS